MGKFVLNPRLIPEMLADAEFQAALEVVGDEGLEEAQRRVPVATGALRDSLRVERITDGRRISANVDYWGFVEYGTADTPEQPYLRPTLTALGLRIAS